MSLDNSPFFQSDEPEPTPEAVAPQPKKKKKKSGRILGLNAVQRLILSVLLFGMVCVVGTLSLLVFGAVKLPFF
jgi:hypothetical protein